MTVRHMGRGRPHVVYEDEPEPLEDVLREIWAAHQWIVNDLMPVDGTWSAEIVSIPEYGVVAWGSGDSPFAAIRAAVANAQENAE